LRDALDVETLHRNVSALPLGPDSMIFGKEDHMKTLFKLLISLLLLTGTMVCDGGGPIPWCPTQNCQPGIAQAGR